MWSADLGQVFQMRGQLCEHRKQKSYRTALVPQNELVMTVPMEKPKDKDEIWKCIGIVLGLVDRSDEVSSVARLKELSKLVLFVACRSGSEVMPGTRRVSKAYRGGSS